MTVVDGIMIASEIHNSKLSESTKKSYLRWITEMITLSHKSPLEITEFDIEEWLREKRKQGVSFKTLQNMKTACNWWLKVLGHRE
jgi:site-specific recombinase XerC